jgi:hypothetical protein
MSCYHESISAHVKKQDRKIRALVLTVFVLLIIIGLVGGSLLYAVTVEAAPAPANDHMPAGWAKHPEKCHGSFRSLSRTGRLWKVSRDCWW